MKLKESDINLVLLCLTFYEPDIIPHYVFLGFKYSVLAWIFYRYHKQFKKNKTILIFVILYAFVTCLSSILNHMAFNTIVASAMFGIQILDIYLLCIYYLKHKEIYKYINAAIIVFGTLLFINDILLFLINYNFSDPSEEYFVGNKFIVSYLHCFVSMLLFMKAKRLNKTSVLLNKGKLMTKQVYIFLFLLLCSIYSIIICAKVTCTTGVIACIVMLSMYFLPDRLRSIISDGKVMIITTALANILVLGTYSLLTMPFFEHIIYNILGKSYTWKGRLIIWQSIFSLFTDSPIIGYGYYNSIVTDTVGFGNPQNGILKLLIDAGIIGTALYGMIVWKSFQHSKRTNTHDLYPLCSFIYAMIAASIVEINLTHMIVFMAMAIYYAESNTRREMIKNESGHIIYAAGK